MSINDSNEEINNLKPKRVTQGTDIQLLYLNCEVFT